jgi:hypothetical protein
MQQRSRRCCIESGRIRIAAARSRDEALDRADRGSEARPRPYALVRRRDGAIDRDLDAVDVERRQPICSRRVDATAVGLDLERDACGREDVEDLPAVRYAERFTAAERDEGNAGFRDPPREVERLAAGELVGPRFVRGRTLRSTRGIARCSGWSVARQEKGAPGTHRPNAPALLIRNEARRSGEADVRLRHHLLGYVFELGVSQARF